MINFNSTYTNTLAYGFSYEIIKISGLNFINYRFARSFWKNEFNSIMTALFIWFYNFNQSFNRNICWTIKTNIVLAPTGQLFKDNMPTWSCKGSQQHLILDCVNCHFMSSSLPQKNLSNCALTSNGWNSSLSFLKWCSRILIVNLTQTKMKEKMII